MDPRLTKIAPVEETIPMKCVRCGAVFWTLNKGPLGKFPIYFDYHLEGQELNKACQAQKHSLMNLKFSLKDYRLRG